MSYRKNKNIKIFFLAILFCGLFGSVLPSYAIAMPWSCNFESGHFCSGLSPGSSNTDNTTAAAAHTGSYGYRNIEQAGHNVGNMSFYGVLDNGGSGFYVRWYMREDSALQIAEYQKLVQIFDISMTINNIYNIAANNFWLEPWGGGNFYVNGGFTAANGSTTGDGQWHCYELHATAAGMQEWWIDGVYQGQSTGANTTLSNFNGIIVQFNTNQDLTSGGNVDWDDMVMSSSYIGPIGGGGGDTTPPAAPSGLSVS